MANGVTAPNPTAPANGDRFKNTTAVGITIAILIVYVAMVILLYRKAGSTDLKWTRWVFLLSGIEAIAFTAVGWIFGKEVHRAQAEMAAVAQQNASDAQGALGKVQGRAEGLAASVRSHAAAGGNVPGVAGASASPVPSSLLQQANELFPQTS